MDVEQVDLARLTELLRRRFTRQAPEGFVRGRTALRDVVLEELPCSALEAEELVDTMVSRGFLRFVSDPGGADDAGIWRIGAESV
jgi:hypothetical protein